MAQTQHDIRVFREPPASALAFSGDAPMPSRASLESVSYRLLERSRLAPGAFEQVEREALEVLGSWGSTVLFARHLAANQGFSVGESSAALSVDFEVSSAQLGEAQIKLVQVQHGTPHVMIAGSARVRVECAGRAQALPSSALSVALLPGTVVELEFGQLKFRFANVPAAISTPRAVIASADRPALASFGLSFAIAAALIAGFAFWTPALGLTDDEELDRDRLVLMKQYLSAQAERNREQEAAQDHDGQKDSDPHAPAAAAQGREGTLGKPNAPVTNRRAAVRGDSPTVELSRARMLEDARTFGVIDLLGSLSSPAGSSSPFARNEALGHDDADFEGNMWGDAPGESGGSGLRLTGLENGGGGHGQGVGIDGVGTCGSGNCGPKGFGKDFGRVKGEHHSTGPSVRIGHGVTSGRLPSEVVQRIVRQNYGRFRFCYENGLRLNPNLTGRVTARFVIGSTGSVMTVQNGGSDIPDSAVVSCVVQAFYGLSFPSPENGVVTVSYPILFSPG